MVALAKSAHGPLKLGVYSVRSLRGEFAMSMRHDRRWFLRRALGTAGAGMVVPLVAACTPTPAPAPPAQSAAPPTTAPAAGASITKVSYAYASPNGFHFVATVAREKPDPGRK